VAVSPSGAGVRWSRLAEDNVGPDCVSFTEQTNYDFSVF
jgi:hypothetical protein